MPADTNRNLARLFFDEVFNKGNLDVVDEIFAPDYRGFSSAAFGRVIEGPEGIKEFVQMYRTAFPNIHFTFDDVIATDNKVIARFTTDGRQEGEFQGIQPKGKRIRVRGIGIAEIADGQIRVSNSEINTLDLLEQIGGIQRNNQ